MLFILVLVQTSHATRIVTNLNRYWFYQQGDIEDAQAVDYDDSRWSRVSLPHSFSIPYFMSPDFYVGYGWYRKEVNLLAGQLCGNRCHTLEFDGVFQVAEVYVNGKLMGKHTGGYTGFEVDITHALKVGCNIIAVRVNNLWNGAVAPRAGEHTFSGGIYRNVRWVEKEPQHFAWYGLSITTPGLAASAGYQSDVAVEAVIQNKEDIKKTLTLEISVIDAIGKTVADRSRKIVLKPHSKQAFSLSSETIVKPKLWSPETPDLYTLRAVLKDKKKVIDQYDETFGFRWFEWTADHGFFFNGKHRFFHGVNVHQDQAGWGDAVTEAAMQRDVKLIKDAGFDFIRGSHYPHAPAFVDACDRIGMLFWSEATFWGIGGEKPDGYWNSSAYPVDPALNEAFEASALQQLEEMIRIHRNHPSIIAWSMSNEPFFSAPEVISGVHRLLGRMVARSRQLDPTRPAAVGGAQRPMNGTRIDLIGDIAGYNGDGARLPMFQNPGIPSVVSEYGSCTADRPGEYEPCWGYLKKNDDWNGVEWRSGQAMWCGFDHGSIAGSTLAKMGIIDYFRIPKRVYYWYRNHFTGVEPPVWPSDGIPVRLRLTASRQENIQTDGTDDVWLLVEVLDDKGNVVVASPDVTLVIKKGPGELPTGRSMTFSRDSDIRILDGMAAITMRAYEAGITEVEATSAGLISSSIQVEFTGDIPYEEGKTRLVRERPYIHYERRKNVEQTFGRNNPIFVTSQHSLHTAAHAADGNRQTYWLPLLSDTVPVLTLDTEKGLNLSSVQLLFPQKHNWQIKVEGSIDGRNWMQIADLFENKTCFEEWKFVVKEYCKIRFIRIRFKTAEMASLEEVEVKGIVTD